VLDVKGFMASGGKTSKLSTSLSSSLGKLENRISTVVSLFKDRKSAALAANVSTDQLNRYTKGENQPPFGAMVSLAKSAGVSIEWLATGEGHMRLSAGETGQTQKTVEEAGLLLLPLFSTKAGAGPEQEIGSEKPVSLLAFREDWIRAELRRNPKNLFLVTVEGDSMFPTLVSGEVVLVDKSELEIGADAIYLLRMGSGVVVKRLQWSPDGQLHILSDNPNFKPFVVDPSKSHEFQILGRVVWGGRRY